MRLDTRHARRETRDARREVRDARSQTRDSRQETGDGRQETGDGRCEPRDARRETLDVRRETRAFIFRRFVLAELSLDGRRTAVFGRPNSKIQISIFNWPGQAEPSCPHRVDVGVVCPQPGPIEFLKFIENVKKNGGTKTKQSTKCYWHDLLRTAIKNPKNGLRSMSVALLETRVTKQFDEPRMVKPTKRRIVCHWPMPRAELSTMMHENSLDVQNLFGRPNKLFRCTKKCVNEICCTSKKIVWTCKNNFWISTAFLLDVHNNVWMSSKKKLDVQQKCFGRLSLAHATARAFHCFRTQHNLFGFRFRY